MDNARTIAIVGGGAAGLAAAASAGERARRIGSDVRIVVYEAADKVGRSVLATGNGRCNFSNMRIDPSVYHNSEYVSCVLAAFERRFGCGGNKNASDMRIYITGGNPEYAEASNGVVAFFAKHGMLIREDGEGRLYPLANKASVVLDVLRASLREAGVEERCHARVRRIEEPREDGGPFTLRMADGVFERADAVIVACGGAVARALLPDVLEYAEVHPVLCPLATDTQYVRQLNNIRVKGALALRREGVVLAREFGEIMFRKFGVSGIAAFNLSRLAEQGDELLVDFLPVLPAREAETWLRTRQEHVCQACPDRRVPAWDDFMRGVVLPQVSDVLLSYCGLDGKDPCSPDAFERLASALKGFVLRIEGPGEVEHAQVHRGGFDPYGFDPDTLEAWAVPGLHVVGEALDVDAPCGGYNLHWAFATGLMAGYAAV